MNGKDSTWVRRIYEQRGAPRGILRDLGARLDLPDLADISNVVDASEALVAGLGDPTSLEGALTAAAAILDA